MAKEKNKNIDSDKALEKQIIAELDRLSRAGNKEAKNLLSEMNPDNSIEDIEATRLFIKEAKESIQKQLEVFNTSERLGDLALNAHKFDSTAKYYLNQNLSTGYGLCLIDNDSTTLQALKQVYFMREEILKEYNIETYSAGLLLDMALAQYARFISFNRWIGVYLSGSMNSEKALIVERFQKMADNCLNQYTRTLATLKGIGQPNINIRNSQVNIANNQQINNQQPGNSKDLGIISNESDS